LARDGWDGGLALRQDGPAKRRSSGGAPPLKCCDYGSGFTRQNWAVWGPVLSTTEVIPSQFVTAKSHSP